MRLLYLPGVALLALALGAQAQPTAPTQAQPTAPTQAAPVAELPARPVQLVVATTPRFDFSQAVPRVPSLAATSARPADVRVDAVVTSAADAHAMVRYLLADSSKPAPPAAPEALTARQFRQYLRRGRRYLHHYQQAEADKQRARPRAGR